MEGEQINEADAIDYSNEVMILRMLTTYFLTPVSLHGSECNLVKLRLGDVQVHRGLTRYAWAKYDSAEAARKACELLRGKSIKSGVRETEVRQHHFRISFSFVDRLSDQRHVFSYPNDQREGMKRLCCTDSSQ